MLDQSGSTERTEGVETTGLDTHGVRQDREEQPRQRDGRDIAQPPSGTASQPTTTTQIGHAGRVFERTAALASKTAGANTLAEYEPIASLSITRQIVGYMFLELPQMVSKTRQTALI